ncbi:MAG TPA: SusD/RagB family nutrient-binding outer membrane lipoprotein, partial [Saprospiraceae bacterium]|nr:SusD/RagB family nutrient-binding outer membrane lipoprotein [Saprospiraceae bacterium]
RIGSFNEFRASKTLLDTLQSLNDPRLSIFFRPTPATESAANKVFIGVPNGMDDVTALTYLGGSQNHSRIGPLWYEDAITPAGLSIAKGVIMTYAELQFLMAEAAQKGWINASANTFYENGIKASMAYYSVTMPDGYLSLPQIALSSNSTENLNKIGFQKWIASFYQGLEAWFDWRRTGIPALKPGVSNQNANRIPVRFIYPIIEQSLNGANRTTAVSRQGVDDINTKMWHLK